MPTTGVGISHKVVPLEDSRSSPHRPQAEDSKSFEDNLIAAEQRLAGEVVPFPNPLSHPPQPLEMCPIWGDVFHDPADCELDSFFSQIEERITTLEHDILSLARQVSSLLRCL